MIICMKAYNLIAMLFTFMCTHPLPVWFDKIPYVSRPRLIPSATSIRPAVSPQSILWPTTHPTRSDRWSSSQHR